MDQRAFSNLMLVKEGPNLADDPLAYCNWYARAFHELQLRLYEAAGIEAIVDPDISIPATKVKLGVAPT